SGASGRVRGGTRPIAIRCWRCTVRSITGPSRRRLRGLNTRKQMRKNYLMLPPSDMASTALKHLQRFIHRPDDRSHLAMSNPLLFPRCGGVEDDALQRAHHTAQGAGRTPHMCLQMETAKKLAERLGPNAAFEAKHKLGWPRPSG